MPVQVSWLWFLPVTFIPIGPFDKSYAFSIAATITDEFGNTYPPITIAPSGFSSLLCIDVAVQLWKKDLDIAAAAAFAAGAIIIWFPWPVCVAGAALITIAAGLAIAAADPPALNPNYLKKVTVVPPAIPKALAAQAPLAPFASVVDSIGRMTATQAALSVIHGRLLGARADGNQAGVKLQSDSYLEGIHSLVSAATDLQQGVRDVMSIQGFGEIFDPKKIKAAHRLMRTGKVTAAIREQWSRAGLTRKTIGQAAKGMRDRRVGQQVTQGIGPSLGLIATSLMRYANRLQQQAPAVLSEPPAASRALEGALIRPWSRKKSTF